MRRPSRPREDLPSSRATRSSGRVTFSVVEPSTNSPGWRISGLLAHVDQLGQVLLVLAHVDDPAGVVAEQPEVLVDVEVDRRGLDAALVERVDDDVAGGERLADGAVGENHAGQTIVGCAPPGVVPPSPSPMTGPSDNGRPLPVQRRRRRFRCDGTGRLRPPDVAVRIGTATRSCNFAVGSPILMTVGRRITCSRWVSERASAGARTPGTVGSASAEPVSARCRPGVGPAPMGAVRSGSDPRGAGDETPPSKG